MATIRLLLKGLLLVVILVETAIAIVGVTQYQSGPAVLCTSPTPHQEECSSNPNFLGFSNSLPLIPLCALSLVTLALFGVFWKRGIRDESRVWITGDAFLVLLWVVGGIASSARTAAQLQSQASTVRYAVLALSWVLVILALANLVHDRKNYKRCRAALGDEELEKYSHLGAPLAENPPRTIVITGERPSSMQHNAQDKPAGPSVISKKVYGGKWSRGKDDEGDGVIR